jgi:hypothetical protein
MLSEQVLAPNLGVLRKCDAGTSATVTHINKMEVALEDLDDRSEKMTDLKH